MRPVIFCLMFVSFAASQGVTPPPPPIPGYGDNGYPLPPPGLGYGAPPVGPGYGAPPVGPGYGAPPVGPGYGAPPVGHPVKPGPSVYVHGPPGPPVYHSSVSSSSRAYCTGQEDCCKNYGCGVGEGDCDSNDDCRRGLECGSNNCPRGRGIRKDPYGWDEEDDCCFDPKLEICRGGEGCCKHGFCGEGEGDCDIDSDCKPGLMCGNDNCVMGFGYGAGSEGWDEKDDCCYDPRKHTNAVCAGGEGCCKYGLCDVGEGDCDVDSDCQPGLKCGTNNCIVGFGIKEGHYRWDEEDDCCYDPSIDPGRCEGMEECCSHGRCGVGEGDCDDDSDCMRGLKCGHKNCEEGRSRSPGSPKFDRNDDCCYDPDGQYNHYGNRIDRVGHY